MKQLSPLRLCSSVCESTCDVETCILFNLYHKGILVLNQNYVLSVK